MATKLTCAARPCASCPYRMDVPSGIWSQEEYDKLPAYDGEIVDQAMAGAFGIFMCHQKNGYLCAGWVAAHGAENLLAMRIRASDVHPYVWDYQTDVPVWSSGSAALRHGIKDLHDPGKKAQRLMDKLLEKGLGRPKEQNDIEDEIPGQHPPSKP